MDLQKILEYSKQNWEKIERKIEQQGHPDAFYFILLPEYADHRFIDPTLPAIGTSTSGAWRGNIINPGMGEFYGIKLDEQKVNEEDPIKIENMEYVEVTFLKESEIYRVTCQKETEPENTTLTRYTAWGGHVIITPEYLRTANPEQLRKVYMELSDFLKSD